MKVSKKQRLSLYVGLALVFGSTISAPSVLAADAQDSHTIVVTATRSEQQLSQVPASVGVVTGDDIRERHATNMNEALRVVPGVDVNTYGGGVGYNFVIQLAGIIAKEKKAKSFFEFHSLNLDFHHTIWVQTGNEVFVKIMKMLVASTHMRYADGCDAFFSSLFK